MHRVSWIFGRGRARVRVSGLPYFLEFGLVSAVFVERTCIVAIDSELLKGERDRLRETLRETEAQVRKVEADLKTLRQREIQTKREIEALSTLIEIKEHRDKPESGAAPAP